jgi:hypothetical protein
MNNEKGVNKMEEIKAIDANELFNKYDEIINITMVNLYTLCKNNSKIILSGLNKKNKDHLFILRVALLAKDIYNFPLELKISFWDWIVLNWRMRKLSRRVSRYTGEYPNVSVEELIDFMYPPIREYMGNEFKFEDIYNQFYRKEIG